MDANTLSAKMIKAEMMGDMDRYNELKKQLDQLNANQSSHSDKSVHRRYNQRNYESHQRGNQRYDDGSNTNELNKLNAKIIKAEIMGNQELVGELKSQLEQLHKPLNSQQSNQRSGNKNNQPKVLSNQDNLNKLTAQLMKAEMMGDTQRVKELKKQLGHNDDSNSDDDDLGPLPTERIPSGPTSEPTRNSKLNQLAKKISEDRLGLKQMFVSAKRGDVEDEAKLFIASSSKLINQDDEYEDVVRKGYKKRKHEEQESKYREEPEDTECGHCVHKVPRRLMIDQRSTIYLCLPNNEPFVDGHCYIRSKDHIRCSVEAEEDCLTEIMELRQKLCLQAKSSKRGVVFIEMYLKKGRNKHFQIECIPIKHRYMADCKMYFKKAILECEMEWSMNKKLVEMKDKCITKGIPKGLSYFWVSFGSTNDSYGHVIEEDKYFPRHFGHEVLAGLLDIDRFKYTKPRPEAYEEQVERGNKFRTIWKQLDDDKANNQKNNQEKLPIEQSNQSIDETVS